MSAGKRDCPSCGMPDQWVNMGCGFCGNTVQPLVEHVAETGALHEDAVIGYRAWSVIFPGPTLRSPVYTHMTWEPGGRDGDGWYWAECEGSGRASRNPPETQHRNDHEDPNMWVPSKECNGGGHGCGFYAGRTRQHLINLGYGHYTETNPHVIGKIQMAGKIIPASNGWRAQQVKPLVLYVPFEFWEIARDLKAAYGPHGVEVEVGATLLTPKEGEDAIEWCHKCKAKMEGRSTRCTFCGYTHN